MHHQAITGQRMVAICQSPMPAADQSGLDAHDVQIRLHFGQERHLVARVCYQLRVQRVVRLHLPALAGAEP